MAVYKALRYFQQIAAAGLASKHTHVFRHMPEDLGQFHCRKDALRKTARQNKAF